MCDQVSSRVAGKLVNGSQVHKGKRRIFVDSDSGPSRCGRTFLDRLNLFRRRVHERHLSLGTILIGSILEVESSLSSAQIIDSGWIHLLIYYELVTNIHHHGVHSRRIYGDL